MSNLSLKPVTGKNRRAAEKLEVFPHQTGFIESVADCMKEADQLAAWHPMCIYDNDTMLGFTMYGNDPGARLYKTLVRPPAD